MIVAHMRELSRRSILGAARQPGNYIPGLFFPFMLTAVYASQFAKAVDLPGFPFPDASFLEFVLVGSVLQGVSFGAINGGSELALDIENGFMDRLLSSPVARPAIIVGRLAGSMTYAVVLSSILTTVFVLMGADIAGGVPAVVALLATSVLLALFLGGVGVALGLRTGSQEVVQSIFPLIFVAVFASSAFFPVDLMDGWYGAIARNNPITWVIDPVRRLTVVDFSWSDVGQALGVAGALSVVTVSWAFLELRRRVART